MQPGGSRRPAMAKPATRYGYSVFYSLLRCQLAVGLAVLALLTLPSSHGAQLANLAFVQPLVPSSCSRWVPSVGLDLGTLYTVGSTGQLQGEACAPLILKASLLDKEPSCQKQDSVLSVEFWALSWDGDSPPAMPTNISRQVADGVFMLVTTGARPEVSLSQDGQLVTILPDNFALQAVVDDQGLADRRSYQAVQLRLQPDSPRLPGDLFVTIANFNPQRRKLSQYAVKAHCHSIEAPPCPSLSPAWGECSSLIGYTANGTQVLITDAAKQNMTVAPSGKCKRRIAQDNSQLAYGVCECAEGLGGYTCASAITNLTALARPTARNISAVSVGGPLISRPAAIDITHTFAVTPRTWSYFWVQVPSRGADPNLLVELWQIPGSGTRLNPVMTITAARIGNEVKPAPGMSYINAADPDECVDVQLSYVFQSIRPGPRSLPLPDAVWVAVFNDALPNDMTMTPTAADVLTLRVRTTDGPRASMACPQDCDNMGTCARTIMRNERSATYDCRCKDGKGGPFCQGDLTVHLVEFDTPTPPRTYDVENLSPGQWHFFQFDFGPGGMSALTQPGLKGTFTISFNVQDRIPDGDDDDTMHRRKLLQQPPLPVIPRKDGPNQGWRPSSMESPLEQNHVFMMLSPYDPSVSLGDNFFSTSATRASSHSAMFQLTVAELRQAPSLMVSIFNSDLGLTRPATYSLSTLWIPSGADRDDHDVRPAGLAWYTVFVAASAGSVVLVLALIALLRVCAWRVRFWRAALLGEEPPQEAGGGMGGPPRPKGIPQNVVAAFPLLQYSSPDHLAQFISQSSQHLTPAQIVTSSGKAVEATPSTHANSPSSSPVSSTTTTTTTSPMPLPLELPAPSGSSPDASCKQFALMTTAAQAPLLDDGPSTVTGPMPASALLPTTDYVHSPADIGDAADVNETPRPQQPDIACSSAVMLQPDNASGTHNTVSGAFSSCSRLNKQGGTTGSSSNGSSSPDLSEANVSRDGTQTCAVPQPASMRWYQQGLLQDEAPSCSVCLSEFERGDMVRVLPPCAHAFHQSCIDPWLGTHDTCPMCRTNLMEAATAAGLRPTTPRRPRTSLASRLGFNRRHTAGTTRNPTQPHPSSTSDTVSAGPSTVLQPEHGLQGPGNGTATAVTSPANVPLTPALRAAGETEAFDAESGRQGASSDLPSLGSFSHASNTRWDRAVRMGDANPANAQMVDMGRDTEVLSVENPVLRVLAGQGGSGTDMNTHSTVAQTGASIETLVRRGRVARG